MNQKAEIKEIKNKQKKYILTRDREDQEENKKEKKDHGGKLEKKVETSY